MKRILGYALVCILGFASISYAQTQLQQYQPGYRLIDGSQLNLMVDQVNTLTTSGTNAVIGVGAGYKIARGETALDGSNPTPVTTGLTAINSCTLTVKLTTAPISATTLSYDTSGGTLNMYAWQPTAVAETTPVASASTDTVGWICIGS